MKKEERQKEILNYLSIVQNCSINDLCNNFEISSNTARNDIKDLEKGNFIEKYYGGIKLAKKSEMSFWIRHNSNMKEKEKIAEYASTLVNNNDRIYIDSGTTTSLLANYIPKDYHLTIVTCNFDFIDKAKDIYNWEIILLGTVFKHSSYSFTEENNWDYFDSLNLEKAFLGTTGFTIKSGATNPNISETKIKSKMRTNVNNAILLADYSKFGQTSLYTFGLPCDFQKIITFGVKEKQYAEELNSLNVDFINLSE